MVSCESLRCSAYDEDLRWRMVWQRMSLNYTYQEIGLNLNVDASTVYRTGARVKPGGNGNGIGNRESGTGAGNHAHNEFELVT